MVIEFVKDYTRPSGRVLQAGSLGEYDAVEGQRLIDEGFAILYAQNTDEVGCTKMTQNRHILLGMNDLVKEYFPEEPGEEEQ